MQTALGRRGFLPEADPLIRFDPDSELARLDALGHDLLRLLQDRECRASARRLTIPDDPGPHTAGRNRRPTHTYRPGNSTLPISKRNVATGGRS